MDTKKMMWIGGGVVALGAAALLLGGSDSAPVKKEDPKPDPTGTSYTGATPKEAFISLSLSVERTFTGATAAQMGLKALVWSNIRVPLSDVSQAQPLEWVSLEAEIDTPPLGYASSELKQTWAQVAGVVDPTSKQFGFWVRRGEQGPYFLANQYAPVPCPVGSPCPGLDITPTKQIVVVNGTKPKIIYTVRVTTFVFLGFEPGGEAKLTSAALKPGAYPA